MSTSDHHAGKQTNLNIKKNLLLNKTKFINKIQYNTIRYTIKELIKQNVKPMIETQALYNKH